MKDAREVLFVGNASNQNRGCEAIIQGTTAILDAAVSRPTDFRFTNGYYGNPESLEWQRVEERDSRITHLCLEAYARKWSPAWIQDRINGQFNFRFDGVHRPLRSAAERSCCALEIGGDNYTLDYGFPEHLVKMDQWLQEQGVPTIVWGASIGPFTEDRGKEELIIQHLGNLTGVFVRESATLDYLANQHGLSNVYQFADPAFLLTELEPESEKVRAKVADLPVAVNISPLLGAYRWKDRRMPWQTTRADLLEWIETSADLVCKLKNSVDSNILLLPHVSSDLPGIDDFGFLEAVHDRCKKLNVRGIRIVNDQLKAREFKWLIARCRLLVAARTHATIAAISSGTPTISLGYSRKAIGINRDVFETEEFCLNPNDLSADSLLKVIHKVLPREQQIRSHLGQRAALLKRSALAAGPKLLELAGNGMWR